jgi:hypothetical protein
MAFKVIKNPGQSDYMEMLPISSLTVANGDLLMLNKGATTWSLATSSLECWQQKAIAQEAATTAATEVKAVRIMPGMICEIDSTNDASASDNGDRMTLTSASTVNNSHSDVDTVVVSVIQRGYKGATTDKKVVGEVIYGSGATQIN